MRRWANGAVSDQPPRYSGLFPGEVLSSDLQAHVGVRRHHLLDPEGVGQSQGHRLLEVDIFARGNRIDRMLGVPVLRAGDQHAVDIVPRQKIRVVPVCVDHDTTLALGGRADRFIQAGFAHVGKGNNLHVCLAALDLPQCGAEMTASHSSGADEAHADGIVRTERCSGCRLRYRGHARIPPAASVERSQRGAAAAKSESTGCGRGFLEEVPS